MDLIPALGYNVYEASGKAPVVGLKGSVQSICGREYSKGMVVMGPIATGIAIKVVSVGAPNCVDESFGVLSMWPKSRRNRMPDISLPASMYLFNRKKGPLASSIRFCNRTMS